MNIVSRDNTAYVDCSEISAHKLSLNNVNPLCKVTELVAKNLLLRYSIPFASVHQFEDIHQSNNKLFSTFVVKLETKGN